MKSLIRSEWWKQRSTWTNIGLSGAMGSLVALAVLLHSLLPADRLADRETQLMVLGRGEFLGTLFAALLGAMSITAEIRYGTIRPTFLVSPRRGRVVAAKLAVSVVLGAALGLLAGSVAVVVGAVAFQARGIDVQLDGSDYGLLVLGAAIASALWAAIGVGVGAILRNQVVTLVAICAWLLFVEGLLVGDLVGIGDISRFLPGAAAAAISGQEAGTLLAPGLAAVLLTLYAGAFVVVGARSTISRDVG
jgi:ABC-2 type transport system permease protein